MTDRSNLIPWVEKLEGAHILVVGDVMLDRFVSGDVERISPEAPIPILRIETEKTMLGGAGNVACNISSLGGEVSFISVVGEDLPWSVQDSLEEFSELFEKHHS